MSNEVNNKVDCKQVRLMVEDITPLPYLKKVKILLEIDEQVLLVMRKSVLLKLKLHPWTGRESKTRSNLYTFHRLIQTRLVKIEEAKNFKQLSVCSEEYRKELNVRIG